MRVRCLLLIGTSALLLGTGCSKVPDAQFSVGQRTQDLIPTAQVAVTTEIDSRFGTPNRLVAWEMLPIEYGRFEGTITKVEGDHNNKLVVDLKPVPPAEGFLDIPELVVEETAPATEAPDNRPVIVTGAGVAEFEDELAEEPESETTAVEISALERQGLLFTSGEYAGQGAVIESYESKRGVITLYAELETPPAEGDTIAVGGGRLQHGRMVYMKNCVHCHGTAGDGAGPTAPYLNPPPRDYRLGVFKFTSTKSTEKVNRDDLKRIVKFGIPGTYMPSFLLLEDEELVDVAEYVRWLSMRGELEKRLSDELAADYALSVVDERVVSEERGYPQAVEAYEEAEAAWKEEGSQGDRPERPERPSARSVQRAMESDLEEFLASYWPDTVTDTSDFLVNTWSRAEDPASVLMPKEGRVEDSPESRARGRALYMSDRTKCYTCHGPDGLGDGSAVEDYWPIPGSTEKYETRGLHDVWGNPLQPRNLASGIYRGGRRPLDIYRRVYAGIKGTPMPAFGGTVLSDAEIWDLVNYVMHVPFDAPSAAPAPVPAENEVAVTSNDGK